MSTQPKAMLLADILQHKLPSIECLEVAATELRRLQAENDALRERCDEIGYDKETYFRLYNSACIELQEIKRNVLPSLQQDANRFRFANDSEEDFAICYWDQSMGNGGEWMCNGYKGNSIDLLDAAIAKVRSDARCPRCGYQHGHAIGCKNNPVDKAIAAIAKETGK